MKQKRNNFSDTHKRRHRILLDVTFKQSYSYGLAVDALMRALAEMDMTEVQIVRPLSTDKVFKAVHCMLDGEIRADLETAVDAMRAAMNKLK